VHMYLKNLCHMTALVSLVLDSELYKIIAAVLGL
jgi:hypothetical protein